LDIPESGKAVVLDIILSKTVTEEALKAIKAREEITIQQTKSILNAYILKNCCMLLYTIFLRRGEETPKKDA
jgi:hypothetical protein